MLLMLFAAAMALPDHDGGIPVTFHTKPEGAEVLLVPLPVGSAPVHRPHQCTAPCVLRIFPDQGFSIFAIGPHQRGMADTELHLMRLTNGRYGLNASEVTFTMVPNSEDR